MSNKKKVVRWSASLTLLSALVCPAIAQQVPILEAVEVQGAVGGVEFPDPARATLRGGTFVNVDNLRQVGVGLSKNQIRQLLGNPNFSEGIAGVSEWNYIFNFRVDADTVLTCQYQVQYERNPRRYTVKSVHWDGPACLDHLNTESTPVSAAVAATPMRITLSANALFDFAEYSEDRIKPNGRAELKALAEQIGAIDSALVTVIGHTDRIGSVESNLLLSQRRARTVRRLLIADGVPAATILAQGFGEDEPVTTGCSDRLSRPALITCLAPDRRVEVTVTTR